MTRSTAEIMGWIDPVQTAQIEAYATGWWYGYKGLKGPEPPRRTKDWTAGVEDGTRALGRSLETKPTQPLKGA